MMIIGFLVVAALIFWVIKWQFILDIQPQKNTDVLKILEERFTKGKFDEKEFEKRKKFLQR